MTNDKELVEFWHKEFIELAKSDCDTEICSNGLFLSRHAELMFDGFCLAKRTQPSVALPKPISVDSYLHSTAYVIDEVNAALTAAGIKYTIGE